MSAGMWGIREEIRQLEAVERAARDLHEALVKHRTWVLTADAEELGRLAYLAQALSRLDRERGLERSL